MARPKNPDTIRPLLLEVGLTLFAKRGYHGTGIKEIVDTAGVPKGSFYNYFKSKEEFGIEIVRWHSADFWQKWHASIDANAVDPLQALQDCFDTMLVDHIDCAVNTFSVVAHLIAEMCETSTECRITSKTLLDDMLANVAAYIVEAQHLGLARSDIDANEMASIFWDAWTGSILRMKIEDNREAMKQCVSLLFGNLFKK
ncbi:MAG: TetR/AcrR family transcriptional regulator [Desulfuromonadaceae bacterium]|nr:TetR/AcrR family transcriptional regulator [Desulfuromonadaceae bacterium]MDD2849310.1 TetR/AcrR family transcriptional regulator [Desulfuromonadaceae bacterium]MDD4131936.1 TetR/AcrR family transcriptional regulator [Desulfuromonadaceae bacterium]